MTKLKNRVELQVLFIFTEQRCTQVTKFSEGYCIKMNEKVLGVVIL